MIFKAENVVPVIYGSNKMEIVADTLDHIAPSGYVYTKIQATENSVLATLVAGGNYEIIGIAENMILPATICVEGQFTEISLVSGKVIAYLTKDNIN